MDSIHKRWYFPRYYAHFGKPLNISRGNDCTSTVFDAMYLRGNQIGSDAKVKC